MKQLLLSALVLGSVVSVDAQTVLQRKDPPEFTARPVELAASMQKEGAGLVWPNEQSNANSDVWIAKNHDKIRQMRPKVLVLNFANGVDKTRATKQVGDLIAAIRESSRYHGYKDPEAPAFLEYQVAKLVDLTDKTPPEPKLDGNSTRYPRVPNWKEGINFQYGRLFKPEFTNLYQLQDPKSPGKLLSLSDAVNRGVIHEVWFLAYQGAFGAPFESIEVKQAYDGSFNKIPGKWVQAGNGGSDEQPFIGRSLRIVFINIDRGVGCALESLSHSWEGTAHGNAIPYFRKYFYEFAGFDFDKRWKLPFNSLYPLWGEGKGISYPDPHTAVLNDGKQKWTIPNYYCIGGNVHFMPNSKGHYDLTGGGPVMSTIEDYRCGSGPGGKDLAKPWTSDSIKPYEKVAPDCMGKWLVYWRQNMPGYRNRAKDESGKPMKNWWPFLFY